MRVEDVMTAGVQTVGTEMRAAEAWELMRRKGIRHLVVLDGKTVVGVLSDRDAGGRSGGALRARSTVGDLMTNVVVTVAPGDTVRRVANLMRGRTIGCTPVLDGSRLVGIVTISDLLELLGRGVDRPKRAERRGLHHRVAHRKGMKRGGTGVW